MEQLSEWHRFFTAQTAPGQCLPYTSPLLYLHLHCLLTAISSPLPWRGFYQATTRSSFMHYDLWALVREALDARFLGPDRLERHAVVVEKEHVSEIPLIHHWSHRDIVAG